MRFLTLPALLVLVAACSSGSGSAEPDEAASSAPATTAPSTTAPAPPTTTAPEVAGVALVPTPARAIRRCERFRRLAPACPYLVPEAPFDPSSILFQADSYGGPPGGDDWTFTLGWGAEHPGAPERDRPPALVHVVAAAGDLARRRLAGSAKSRDGLLAERRRGFLLLGRVIWAGRRGTLVLAPPYPRGGIEGNHLVFEWRQNRSTYRLSVHGWEPFSEVPAVLRAMVGSLPP
jgi:hypothetical protein